MRKEREAPRRTQGPRSKAAAAAELELLTRLTQNAHDLTTPLGAFLAALPQPPKRRAKTSSERGRAFRERQQRYEDELEQNVEKLKREIIALDLKRKAREMRFLNLRTGPTGSLVQTIREYHRLFVHGLLELPTEPSRAGIKRSWLDEGLICQVKRQEEFIRQVIHPTAIVGSLVGPEASIVQWRRYTQSHATMTALITSTDVVVTPGGGLASDEDIVIVIARCLLRVRFSRETFKMMFPHMLSNETILQRLIGKEVTYYAIKRFEFSSDGRIATESVDVDFMGGLTDAGCSLEDISALLGGATITSDSMIVEVEEQHVPTVVTCEELKTEDGEPCVMYHSPQGPDEGPDAHDQLMDDYRTSSLLPTSDRPLNEPTKNNRLSMAFLLAEETEPSPSVAIDTSWSRALHS